MRRLLAPTLAVLLCSAAPALGAPHTTAERTIQDCDGDQLLESAPGEPHADLTRGGGGGEACRPDRQGTRPLRLPETASLLNFLQLSDFQIVDEESPGRVEFLDGSQRIPNLNPFAAAYRPQESLTTQITEASVRQARGTTSPVTGARLDFSLLTGDNADSQQYNETRWFIDILDGTAGGGNPDPEMETPPDRDADRKVDPNSGVPAPGCESTPGSVYDGVRDQGRTTPVPDNGYYEPDASSEPREDGDGYSPLPSDNEAETGRPVRVRDFPGLLERANAPFEAIGLGMPWYSAFGNHDALVQGNSPEAYFGPGGLFPPGFEEFDPVMNAVATGCVKVQQPATPISGTPDEIQEQALAALAAAVDGDPQTDPGTTDVVPGDTRRCYLAKDDPMVPPPGTPCATGSWIAQHFRTTGTPPGHGFAPSSSELCGRYADDAEAACRQAAARNEGDPGAALGRPLSAVLSHDGYYSFVPRPGFRFVALDTVTDECGAPLCAEGSVDDAQFRWLEEQLRTAAARREHVFVFSHHTLRTTRSPNPDPSEQPVHYGQRVDREQPANPQNPSGERTLEEVFCEYPAVIAHVTGHEHQNYVRHHRCAREETFPTPGPGDFYEISTAAHIDYPQQSRMIEVVRVGGTLALVLTMLDHAGPAYPGNSPLGVEQGAAGDEVLRLASIGREIAYNDYQGSPSARGTPKDRNVILPLERPALP